MLTAQPVTIASAGDKRCKADLDREGSRLGILQDPLPVEDRPKDGNNPRSWRHRVPPDTGLLRLVLWLSPRPLVLLADLHLPNLHLTR